jgi:hypothetical protein
VCQTVCMPYNKDSNSSNDMNITVRSNLSLLVTAADSVDYYYSNLASDVPWYISAHIEVQSTNDGCDTDSNSVSVVQPFERVAQSFEWEDATGIDSNNDTAIYSDCDNQHFSGYKLQTVIGTLIFGSIHACSLVHCGDAVLWCYSVIDFDALLVN